MFLTKKFLFNSSLLCLFSVKSFAVAGMPFFENWLDFSSEEELTKFYSRTSDNFIKITNDLTGFNAQLNQDLTKYFWGAKYVPFIGGQYESYVYQDMKANMPIFSNLDETKKYVYFIDKKDGTNTIFANLEIGEVDANTTPLWDFDTAINYDIFYGFDGAYNGVLHYDTVGMSASDLVSVSNSVVLVNEAMTSYEVNNSIVDFSNDLASLSSMKLNNSYMNSNIANGAEIENLSVDNSYVDGNYSGYGEINATNSVFTGELKGYSKANFNNVISSGLIFGFDELIATNSKLSNIEEVKSLNLSNSIYQIDITKNTFQPLFVSENTSGDNNTLEFLNVVSNNVINYDYFKDQMQLAILAKGMNNISETFFNNFIAYQDDLITLNVDRNYIATNNTASELIYYINNPVKISVPAVKIEDTATKSPISIPATKIEDTAIKTPIDNTLPSEETNANPSIDESNASNQESIPATKIEDTAIKTPIALPNEDVKDDNPSIDETLVPSSKDEEIINDNTKDNIIYDDLNNDLDTDVIDYNTDNSFTITLSDEEIRELSKLSDEELKAFGFTRSEIDEKLKEIDNKTIAFNDIIKPTLNDKTSLKLDELNAFLNLNFYDISTLNKRAINLRNAKVLNGVWTRGSGARTNYNKQFAFKSNDFYLGADRLNNLNNYDLYLGAFLSASYKYSSTKGFIKQNGFGGGLYATLLSDSFYLDAIFSYTNVKNQLNDDVLGDLKAKNNLYKLSFESGYKFGDKYYYEPSLKLNLAYSDKLNFKNSKLSLNKDSKLFANIEARMNFGASLNEYINTNLALGYSYDLTKLSDLDIDIYGLKFAKNNKKDKKFLVNFGTSFNITNNLMIIVDYEQSFSGIYNTSHNINSSFRYTF
ncbi:autotransporter domain-containing protein [Campylobacter sp. RM5004]|uniref:hypothetical protein n=1 Tax=Campylobacter sp. RM5004 TaxID=1660078 RepID=UPI001EFB0069|nr:hypothetical protein [Campylobacter sp. RM5004]ULO02060.1 autotransporter domain-containing protein [Campylobacter sp. RM5004]